MDAATAARTGRALRKALGYLSDDQVASLLGITVATLRNRRTRGDAPRSSKVGAQHLTTIEDVKTFVARRTRAAA